MVASSIVFNDASEEAEFQKLVLDAAVRRYGENSNQERLIRTAIATMRRIEKPADTVVALFVSGTKLKEGNLSEMNKLFENEIIGHSAPTQLRQQERDGSWRVIRSRQ